MSNENQEMCPELNLETKIHRLAYAGTRTDKDSDFVQQIISMVNEARWVSVENPPEYNQSVWLNVKVPKTETWQLAATYVGNGVFVPHGRVDNWKGYTPTHWMPLPHPPKQEDSDE